MRRNNDTEPVRIPNATLKLGDREVPITDLEYRECTCNVPSLLSEERKRWACRVHGVLRASPLD